MIIDSGSAVFEMSYGTLQRRYQWLIPFLFVVGLVGIPVGIFWNEGWEISNRPVEPWAATVMIEAFSLVALIVGISAWYAGRLRRNSPQRVVVTETALIVPKGYFSNVELTLPLAEVDVSVFKMGIVTQLQIKHGRRKVLLSNAMSQSNEHFAQLCEYVA